jgi:hypothetical protein
MEVLGIIRTLGERSLGFAQELLEEQVDSVEIVSGITPAPASVIKSYEIALESGAQYFVQADADLFILPGVIQTMVEGLKKLNTPVLTSYTKSKFFGKREGGVRLYNCRYLGKFLAFVRINELPLRPEARLWKEFGGRLMPGINSYHEYEQYYQDIYKRFVVQSHKSKKPSHAKLIYSFKDSTDMDLLVAYHGYFDETKDFDNSFPGLKEKGPLDLNQVRNCYARGSLQ